MNKKEKSLRDRLKEDVSPLARRDLMKNIQKLETKEFPEPPLASRSLYDFVGSHPYKTLTKSDEEER